MRNGANRIAHVFPSHSWGGAEIYAVQLAAAQLSAGLNVAMWVPQGSRLEAAALQEGIPVINDPVPWRFSPTQIPRLSSVIGRCRVDVLYCHWSGGLWAFLGVGWFHRVRRIYHIHLWMKHSKKDPLHWLLYQIVDIVIVAGNRARDQVSRLLPVPMKKVHVIPYAIPDNPLSPEDRALVRKEIGLSETAIVVGLFARRDRQKGYVELIQAVTGFQLTQKKLGQESNLNLLLVGDATYGEEDSERYSQEVDRCIERSEVPIVALPSQRNFRRYLGACDVLAVPSYHESYSLMILHAFALGIPVMASSSGGTPDLVAQDRGWLFQPESVTSIQSVLSQLSPQSIAKKKYGLWEYVSATHTFPSVIARITKIIESLH